jgi:acyl-CoA reductase-like NAD-dependent aldehyde dehydrogenase
MSSSHQPGSGAIVIPEAVADRGHDAIEEVDAAVAAVAARKDDWAALPIPDRRRLLDQMVRDTMVVAGEWAEVGGRAKGLQPGTPAWGEEIAFGPMQVVRNLRLLDRTLASLEGQGHVGLPGKPRVAHDGRIEVPAFPTDVIDRLAYAGHTGFVRLQGHVTDPADVRAGAMYERPREGRVALVLGAGNASSLGPADVLTKLYAEHQVCVLKINPVNAEVGPFLETAMQVLVREGFLRVVYGGVEVGQHLVDHPMVDTVHMTASDKTYEAVVFGPGEEGQQNKRDRRPRTTKEVTAELGAVSPVIVVPGPWSADDLAYQGKQLASMLTSNAGFTCGCPRVLVTHRAWNRRRDLLDALRGELSQVPHREAYYPGARQRWEVFTDAHPEAELYGPLGDDEVPYTLLADVDPSRHDDIAFRVEAFNTTIAETGLDAPRDAAAFVDRAVDWANDTLWGTLAATILVHPRSLKDPAVAAAIDRAVANLRYGTVGVNVWALTAYGLASLPWGGYPGSPAHDIQSGVGWVRNTYLLEDVEKSVLRAPWRLGKKPPMAYDFSTFDSVTRRILQLEASRDWRHLPGIVADGMRA